MEDEELEKINDEYNGDEFIGINIENDSTIRLDTRTAIVRLVPNITIRGDNTLQMNYHVKVIKRR